MRMWPAILLVAIGSYAFRVTPMLLGERMRVSERADRTLRHAAVGAMTALLVFGLERVGGGSLGRETLAACLGVAVAGGVALRGRSMPVVLLAGAAAYGVAVLGLVTVRG